MSVFIVLLVIAVSTFGGILHTASGAKKRLMQHDDRCKPTTVDPSHSVSDRYDRQVLSLDPSLYLTLGSSSASAELDLSGHGHNGNYAPGAQDPRLTQLPNGDPATVFNGYDQYVEVPSTESLSIAETGCLTVEAWIRPTVLQFPREQGSGYVYILGKGITGRQEYAMRIYSYSNSETPPRPNRISAYTFNLSGGKGSGAYFQDKVSPDEWIMVTFVIDSRPSAMWPDGYISIYKNGYERGTKVSLGQFNVKPEPSNAPFRIATRDLESFFYGAVGKVAVYNSVLSAQDILSTYKAMVPQGR